MNDFKNSKNRLTRIGFLGTLGRMTQSRLPRSIRVRIRREKARIRREISDKSESERKIMELVVRVAAPYTEKRWEKQRI